MLGGRLDCWRNGVSILGARYLHMYEFGGTLNAGISFPTVAIGLGVDAGVINVSAPQDSDKGAIVDAVLRGAMRFPLGLLTGELTSGMAAGPGGPIQSGSAGAFWSLYFLDVGYSYGFLISPARRPEWLSSGMFSVRLQFPLEVFGSGSEPARAPTESARAR